MSTEFLVIDRYISINSRKGETEEHFPELHQQQWHSVFQGIRGDLQTQGDPDPEPVREIERCPDHAEVR